MSPRPRILVLSFSPIASDARVLRHIDVLSAVGDVTSCGFGPAPTPDSDHVRVERLPSLPQTPAGVALLSARRYDRVERAAPALRAGRPAAGGPGVRPGRGQRRPGPAGRVRRCPRGAGVGRHARVGARGAHARLALAADDRAVRGAPLPDLPAPCGRRVHRREGQIADLYRSVFGLDCEVVRNTRAFSNLLPSPADGDRVRLVHSGAAVHGRFVEGTMEGVRGLDDRFTLDLYLMPGGDGGRYLRALQAKARREPRITIREPVTPAQPPATLNAYDVGVFQLPPVHTNARLTLPNKLFDDVQARLALVVSPLVEMERLVREHDLGVVTDGYTAEDLRRALAALDPATVERHKRASHASARLLSSETDAATVRRIAERLLGR